MMRMFQLVWLKLTGIKVALMMLVFSSYRTLQMETEITIKYLCKLKENTYCIVKFKFSRRVTTNNSDFWDVMQRGSCKKRSFGRTYRLHHQGEMNQRARHTFAVAS
jgi:hypothetical protein